MSDAVLERLSRLIVERILDWKSTRQLAADTPLLSFGLDLDSVAILELLMAVEQEFGVMFDDSEVSLELFKSVGTLATAIQRKLGAGNGNLPGRQMA